MLSGLKAPGQSVWHVKLIPENVILGRTVQPAFIVPSSTIAPGPICSYSVLYIFFKTSWHFLASYLHSRYFFPSWPFLPRWNTYSAAKMSPPLYKVFPTPLLVPGELFSIFICHGLFPHKFIVNLTVTLILSPLHKLWIFTFLALGNLSVPDTNYVLDKYSWHNIRWNVLYYLV